MVAIALALEQPDYVRSLLLLSGYYYPTPRIDVPLFSPPALYDFAFSGTVDLWPIMVRKLFSPAETPMRFKKEYLAWMGLHPSQIRASAEEMA